MRWLLIIAAIIGVALDAAVWSLGGSYFALSRGLEALLTVVLLSPIWLTALVLSVRALLRRRAARPSRPVGPTVDPAALAEIRAKLGELRKLVQATRAAGAELIEERPWVLVAGPSGSGKTAAILGSRLKVSMTTHIPLAATRLDVFVTERGVLVEVSGRYAAANPDGPTGAEWRALLDALASLREPRAIDAVLAVVDLSALLAGPPAAPVEVGRMVRAQLFSVRDALGWDLPVHLLFTHADRLPGFVDSFKVLPSADRARVLGVKLESGAAGEALARLLSRVRAEAHLRLPRLDFELRAPSYIFPEQFRRAIPAVEILLRTLTEPSAMGERIDLRGANFGSGVQDGALVDLLQGELEARFDLSRQPARPPGDEPETRSLFLSELFAQVLLGGRPASGRSIAGRARRRRGMTAKIAATAGAALTVILLASISFSANRALLARAEAAVAEAREPRTDDPTDQVRFIQGLADLGELLIDLSGGAPPWHRLGLYQGTAIFTPLRQTFDVRMRAAFVDPASGEAEAALLDPRGSEDAARDYELLEAYLMVTAATDHLDLDLATRVWVEEWKRQLNPAVAQRSDLIERAARAYLGLLQLGLVQWRPTSNQAIDVARRSLIDRDAEYQRLIVEQTRSIRALRLPDLVGARQGGVLTARAEIPGAYTLEGWKAVRGHLGDAPEGAAAWVLGRFDSDDALGKSLEEEYYGRFRDSWKRFLRELSVARTPSFAAAQEVIAGLVDGEPMYKVLIKEMRRQLSFPSKTEEIAKTAPESIRKVLGQSRGAPNPVQEFFRPLFEIAEPRGGDGDQKAPAYLDEYLGKLVKLSSALAKVQEKDPKALDAVHAVANEAKESAEAILQHILDQGLRDLLTPLLIDPLSRALENADMEKTRWMTTSFETSVCDVFYEKLAKQYPFAASQDEALLEDVTAFFGPSGTVWTFYDASLKDQLVRQGDQFVDSGDHPLPENVTAFYNAALLVKSALFPNEAKEIGRLFQVKARALRTTDNQQNRSVGAVVLVVGDERYKHDAGAPEVVWKVPWPAKSGGGASLVLEREGREVESLSGGSGDWALFRLAQHGEIAPDGGSGWRDVVWRFKSLKVEVPIAIRMDQAYPIFDRARLARLACRRRASRP